jgi:hypothetical protein
LHNAHFDVFGQFDFKLAVVFHLDDLADQTALGNDLIATAQDSDGAATDRDPRRR